MIWYNTYWAGIRIRHMLIGWRWKTNRKICNYSGIRNILLKLCRTRNFYSVADSNLWYIYNNNRNRELNIVLTDCSTLKIVECFEFIFICSAGVELAFSPCTTTKKKNIFVPNIFLIEDKVTNIQNFHDCVRWWWT